MTEQSEEIIERASTRGLMVVDFDWITTGVGIAMLHLARNTRYAAMAQRQLASALWTSLPRWRRVYLRLTRRGLSRSDADG